MLGGACDGVRELLEEARAKQTHAADTPHATHATASASASEVSTNTSTGAASTMAASAWAHRCPNNTKQTAAVAPSVRASPPSKVGEPRPAQTVPLPVPVPVVGAGKKGGKKYTAKVMGLPTAVSHADVLAEFSKCGAVRHIKQVAPPNGTAFWLVVFEAPVALEAARQCNARTFTKPAA